MKKLTVLTIALILFAVSVNAQITVWNQQGKNKLVSARLYGAIPNDGHSDKAALRYLIRKVSAMENTYIVLEPGKYDVKKLRIDYEILEETGRVADTTPTPAGYIKMFYIFLVPENTQTGLAIK